MRRRWGWLVGGLAVACCCGVGATPALAGGESLAIKLPNRETVHEPLTIAVAGLADGVHRLYVYVDEAGRTCAANPSKESMRSLTTVLSSAAGDTLGAGPFEAAYTFIPQGLEAEICGYLDETSAGVPDVLAGKSENPVNEYLENEPPAQFSGTNTFTGPGAIEPGPVDQQAEEEFYAHARAWEARGRIAVGASGAQLQITPGLEGGWVGWCLIVLAGRAAVAHCPIAPRAQHGVAYELWQAMGSGTRGVALVNAPVHGIAVAVDYSNASIAAAPVSGVPELAGAVVEIPAPPPAAPQWLDEFEPVIYGVRESSTRGPNAPQRGYSAGLPATAWKVPERPPAGACSITAVKRAGLKPRFGHVATRLFPAPGIAGGGFASCIDTVYTFGREALDAAVLLDAARPDLAAPAPLPNAAHVRHHAGLFSAPGWHGQILARRVGEAWLAVEGGSSLRQRIQLLSLLRATVKG